MKKLALILAVLATAAFGQQVTMPDGSIREGWPVMLNGAIVSQADLVAAGAHLTTDAEREAWQAAALAAQGDPSTNALPVVFESGIAVVDKNGHHVELVPEGQDVIAVQISASPLDPATRRAMKQAAVTAERQRRQEWRTANLALRSSLTNNMADVEAIRDGLTATSTAAQVRSALIATVRELRQAQGDIRELRRLLANHVREDQ